MHWIIDAYHWSASYFPTLTMAIGLLLFPLVPLIIAVAMYVWWERKVIGWMHVRMGPNQVGPLGLAQTFADYTAEPTDTDGLDADTIAQEKAQAAQWRKVQALLTEALTDLSYADIGYRAYERGSLETGAVAHVFYGRLPSGALVAIWGIDIWT